jgi:hypothetical protein
MGDGGGRSGDEGVGEDRGALGDDGPEHGVARERGQGLLGGEERGNKSSEWKSMTVSGFE